MNCPCSVCTADRVVTGVLRVVGASLFLATFLYVFNVLGQTL